MPLMLMLEVDLTLQRKKKHDRIRDVKTTRKKGMLDRAARAAASTSDCNANALVLAAAAGRRDAQSNMIRV